MDLALGKCSFKQGSMRELWLVIDEAVLCLLRREVSDALQMQREWCFARTHPLLSDLYRKVRPGAGAGTGRGGWSETRFRGTQWRPEADVSLVLPDRWQQSQLVSSGERVGRVQFACFRFSSSWF